jgi:hypothetical protein
LRLLPLLRLLRSSAIAVPERRQAGKRGDECDPHGRVPRLVLDIQLCSVRRM